MGRRKIDETMYPLEIEGQVWKYQTISYYSLIIITPNGGRMWVRLADMFAVLGLPTVKITDSRVERYIRQTVNIVPQLTQRRKATGERNLTIGKEVWGWKVGKKNVLITAPSGKKTAVPFDPKGNVVDVETKDVMVPSGIGIMIDLPKYCCEFHCFVEDWYQRMGVTPASVKEYIESHRADLV